MHSLNDIFLTATYNVDRLAAAAIAKTEPLEHGERGVIINTASIAAFDGTIGQAAYGAGQLAAPMVLSRGSWVHCFEYLADMMKP